MKTLAFASSSALAALLALSAPAAAQDVDAFLDRLQAVIAEQGSTVVWSGIEQYDNGDGEPVIALTDVTLGSTGGSAQLDLIELIDVTEEDDGGWRIDTIRVPEYSRQDGDTAVYLTEMTVTGMTIEPEGQENAFGSAMIYEGIDLAEVAVTNKDKDVFTMQGMTVNADIPEGGGVMEFSGSADSFDADLTAIEDAKTKAALSALGYQQISGHFVVEGDWDPAEGRITMSRYDVTVDDAGTIGLTLEIGGYTPDFIRSLRETQAAMAANSGDNSSSGLAMMGLMQQLSFNSARIHFYDDTLTEKALEFVASQQGARARDVANQAKAMVPFMMMQLGDQNLTAQTSAAVSTFLDNPQSLIITAEPPAPVPFAMIMAGAMSAPQSLLQTLAVGVKANECRPAETTC